MISRRGRREQHARRMRSPERQRLALWFEENRPNVLPSRQLERRALQLGHAAGVQVHRSAGPEERVTYRAGAIVVGRVARARNDHVDGVRHK